MAKKKKKKGNISTFLTVVIIVGIISYLAKELYAQDAAHAATPVDNIEYVIFPETMTNEPVHYTGFTVYFNRDTHLPNVTVYELTATEAAGTHPRKNDFFQDENVEGCPTLDDYKFSGFDRGHMVPAGDMKWDAQAMNDCFSLANMVPQNGALNSGAWNKLEQKVRNWAERDSAIVILTGPIIEPEDLQTTIGESGVVVPSSIYKIVLAPYASPMRAIAFVYPNKKAKGGLKEHVTTVDAIEDATGMDFFSTLPDDIESQIETTSDLNLWNKH